VFHSSGHHASKHRSRSKRQEQNDRLLGLIRQAYRKGRGTYGSPRVTAELRAQGICSGKNRVARLMREHGICARRKRTRRLTTHSRHRLPVAPNLLNQQFTTDAPNRVWTSDITYIRTQEGWLYLAAVLDTYSRKIVGWSMGNQPTDELVIHALHQALSNRRPGPGLLFHSDRGSQYASLAVTNILKAHGCIHSMSSTGNCYDNAITEAFLSSLKTEWVHLETYYTRNQARRNIFDYIEIFYNRVRRHSGLGYCSPAEFETLNSVT
jgi:transposase InsO family protein